MNITKRLVTAITCVCYDKLKINKAPGPDQIHPRILKEMSSVIAPILTMIYCKSYKTGELPDVWKLANITPVFKKGKRSDPSNYRPISLTCIAKPSEKDRTTFKFEINTNLY